MAYLISEEAQDLLEDVKKFCENEVKNMMSQGNGRKKSMTRQLNKDTMP